MQLDETRIAVRERDLGDLLDLAVCLLRSHFWPLALLVAAGAAPWIALNAWLLSELIDPDFFAWPDAIAYALLMIFLVDLQIPLATAPATLYLGQAVHHQRPNLPLLLRQWLASLPQLLLLQLVLRAMMIFWVVTWFVPFFMWPYLNEVILLERNPLWGRRRTGTSTVVRNWSLHSRSSGTLLGRRLGTLVVAAVLLAEVWALLWLARAMLFGNFQYEDVSLFSALLPAALWSVAGFLTVVRLLGYLDLRIRHEGWDVELVLRTEGRQLARGLA